MIGRKHRSKTKQAAQKKPLPLTKEGKIDWAKVPQKIQDKMFSQLVPLEDFLNGKIHWLCGVGSSWTDELEALKSELITDLSPIADLSESRKFKRSERIAATERMKVHLEYLCEKITYLEGLHPVFDPGWPKIEPKRRLQSRAQGVFSWGIGEWHILFAFSRRDEGSPRSKLYAYVATGLVSGELARLRRCGYCQTFFIAPQPRMAFCPGHARLYYDRPSQRVEQQN